MKKHLFFVVFCLIACTHVIAQQKRAVYIQFNPSAPAEVFGVTELKNALVKQHIPVAQNAKNSIVIKTAVAATLPQQAYSFKKQGAMYLLTGGDAVGVMYGLNELADRISLGKPVARLQPFSGKPYIAKRGLKFNIPLDARTPSYADNGFAAQNNIATMWEFSYWQNFLDNMARYRYNVLSFWNLHQFPSMVKVPDYPDVALNDVYVKDDVHSSKMHIVKKITIDEKIAFWRKVFKYANDRGIDIQWYNWSVFVGGTEGKYGIKDVQDSPVTIDYTRKSVKQFLLTYPNVSAIGVTAGEHQDNKQTGKYAIENWLAMTYGEGMMDAQKENPALENTTLIFRQHYTKLDIIKNAFKDYTGPFETEFKYARARMYATVNPPWFDSIYRADVVKYNVKCWQNIRNDDFFIYRWGDPVYAAKFIKNIPLDVTAGFVIGDDGYMYGKDFASKNPAVYGKYEIDKNWYDFMIWGRTAYNPSLPESFYKDQLRLHFPNTDINKLYTTWRATSDIVSWIDKQDFNPNDFEFDLEGCFDRKGFLSINDIISSSPLPGEVMSIVDYVKQKGKPNEATPFDVADKLDAAAEILLKGAATMPPTHNADLAETISDFSAWAYLGRYYAAKFRGATYTAMLRNTGKEEYREKAVASLTRALADWKNYAAISTKKYIPQLFSRPANTLDWDKFIPDVEKDIVIAKTAKQGDPIKQKSDNRLWKITSKYY